jgi:DNA-binding winged helix-turn-helix (wHTH) protein
MPDAFHSEGQFRFEAYSVDLRTGELRKHGQKVRLAGRPFEILAMLLERPGELLTRKELQARLWPADTFVDFEHGMNAAVQTLRRALCDSHRKPRFIETLPRRGYRFIAAVEKLGPKSPAAPSASQPGAGAPTDPGGRNIAAPSCAPTQKVSAWVGQVATIRAEEGRQYVLLPINEDILEEMRDCEAAKDDLGISLLVAAEKLLMVNNGTKVKILDARNPARGCKVRILGGQFVGEQAFAPRAFLSGLS